MSSKTTIDGIARSAFRLRVGLLITIVLMVLLYGTARLGLKLGTAPNRLSSEGPGSSIDAVHR